MTTAATINIPSGGTNQTGQLVRQLLNQEPVDFNGEPWYLSSIGPCRDNCPQHAMGYDCAGVVALVHAADGRFETSGLHVRAVS